MPLDRRALRPRFVWPPIIRDCAADVVPKIMPILVQKYGGSSVATIEKIREVASKIVDAKRAGYDVCVVVSAMGKSTDELLSLARKAAFEGKDPPRRELDMLLTTGERVSMALLSIAIQSLGFDAISFTGSQSGILTNDRHFDARIIEVRPHRIEDELSRGKIVIVAGYQGMSYKREITTLGRGGSDTTAVALAAALNAERCEIYSDVDGVYTADPRVVGDPKHLPEISLEMMQEMAESGAKVLNAQAIEWARKAKIAIYARRTSDPPGDATTKETIARERETSGAVRAVVGLDRIAALSVTREALPRFLGALAEQETPVLDLHVSETQATCVVPLLNVPDWSDLRAKILGIPGVVCTEDKSYLSIVGQGMSTAVLQRLIAHAAKESIALTGISLSPLRLSCLVDAKQLAEAQRVVHSLFVE